MKYRPFAAPVASAPAAVATAGGREPEYPSIDEFIDELPPIEEFLADKSEFVPDEYELPAGTPPSYEMAPHEADVSNEETWLEAGWGSYDFSGLSELASRSPSTPGRRQSLERQTASQPGPNAMEVADALDSIAWRIRSGELEIDNLQSTPEAAMAAAIAALLRMRG